MLPWRNRESKHALDVDALTTRPARRSDTRGEHRFARTQEGRRGGGVRVMECFVVLLVGLLNVPATG